MSFIAVGRRRADLQILTNAHATRATPHCWPVDIDSNITVSETIAGS